MTSHFLFKEYCANRISDILHEINLLLNLNLMVVESNMYAAPDENWLMSAAITVWSYHYFEKIQISRRLTARFSTIV